MFKRTWELLLDIENNHQEIKIGVLEDYQQFKCFLKNRKTGKRSQTSMTTDKPELLQKAYLKIK